MNYHEIEEMVVCAIEQIESVEDLNTLEESITIALDEAYSKLNNPEDGDGT